MRHRDRGRGGHTPRADSPAQAWLAHTSLHTNLCVEKEGRPGRTEGMQERARPFMMITLIINYLTKSHLLLLKNKQNAIILLEWWK